MSKTNHLFILPILTSILLLSNDVVAEGGASTGNGGDAVVCRKSDGAILTVELLDYYEARTLRGLNQDLGAAHLTVEEKIQIALSRLEMQSPKRAQLYREQAQNFSAEAKFLRGTDLVDIPDSGHLIIPNNCKVEQIVIQRQPEFPQDKRYLINGDLWDYLSNTSKAGLILHEIVYREAIAYQHPDSKRVRYFNSILASDVFPSRSFLNFLKLLQSTWMDAVEVTGNSFKVYKDEGRKTLGVWTTSVNESRYDLHLDTHPTEKQTPISFVSGEVKAFVSGTYRFDESDSLLEIRGFGSSFQSFQLFSKSTSEVLWKVSGSNGSVDESSSLVFEKDPHTRYGRLLKWVNSPRLDKKVFNMKTGLKFVTTGDLEFSDDYETIRVLGPNASITLGNMKIVLPNSESTITFHSGSLQNETHDIQVTLQGWIDESGESAKEIGPGCFIKGSTTPLSAASIDLETSSSNELSTIKTFELAVPVEVLCEVSWQYSNRLEQGTYPDGYDFTIDSHAPVTLGKRGEIIRAKTLTPIKFYTLAKEPFAVRVSHAQRKLSRGCRRGARCTPKLLWKKESQIERAFDRTPKQEVNIPAGATVDIGENGRLW